MEIGARGREGFVKNKPQVPAHCAGGRIPGPGEGAVGDVVVFKSGAGALPNPPPVLTWSHAGMRLHTPFSLERRQLVPLGSWKN